MNEKEMLENINRQLHEALTGPNRLEHETATRLSALKARIDAEADIDINDPLGWARLVACLRDFNHKWERHDRTPADPEPKLKPSEPAPPAKPPQEPTPEQIRKDMEAKLTRTIQILREVLTPDTSVHTSRHREPQ